MTIQTAKIASVMLTACVLMAGCVGSKDPMPVVSAGSYTVPLPTAAMLFIAPRDLERPLVIEATLHRNEETSTPDGRLLEAASLSVLRQVFRTVETNQPTIQPRLVVKVQGQAKFSRRDRMLRVSCTMDAYQADGTVIGSYFARYDGAEPVEYKDAIQPGYQRCLTRAANDMMNSPALARLHSANFPAPHPAAYKSFVASLGLKPTP